MIARYIDEKTEQLRHKQFQEGFEKGFKEGFKEGFEKGFEEGLKMARDWFRRREAAAARGRAFRRAVPGEQAEREKSSGSKHVPPLDHIDDCRTTRSTGP